MNQQRRYLDTTIERLITESNKARNAIAWWLMCFVAAGLSIAFGWGKYGGLNELRMSVSLFFFALGGCLFLLNLLRYARINGQFPDDEDEPELPTGRPIFQSEQRTRPAAIVTTEEIDDSPGTPQWLVGRYGFTVPQWRKLIKELRIIKWRWNKKALEESGIFTVPICGHNVTADGVYKKICADFERVGIIEGAMRKWRVTEPEGMELLHTLAELNVVTSHHPDAD